MLPKTLIASILVGLLVATSASAKEPAYSHAEDVIYGRKFGTALTMDVFRPKEGGNGAAIISVVSGGWFSSHDAVPKKSMEGGYTVFAVVHGSQPRFTIEDAVADINRAVRFIRYHAADYGIDPDRIGIMGGSAGGHLSLMQGIKPIAPDNESDDPVERTSSRVQAVACFFPPTDFLNYGEPDKIAWETTLDWLPGPFDFERLMPENKKKLFSRHFVKVTAGEQKEIAKEMSPLYWVTSEAAPTLIIHGDADRIVPFEQSERIIKKFEEAKVPAKLEVRKGRDHGWPDTGPDIALMREWFDQHLAKKADEAKVETAQ
ncbi:MAG: alpha/beta hydrolase [Pirellulales bacterium]